ncbi:aspartokinase 1, chloroplastic-like [Hordeum vulgare subsp. vulgare]|uniref:aspartokinase 1, chloroplastic-like n=1 Tax=Hordeum vulgare subsp. vulgare TaxID=112509 RepID=UPI001D1A3CE4|nr:aspartokinase 1, chloroplastic-like [Hordeum vulgare subsp. vulgare]
MKFGRSSMPSAERIKEMAKLVLNFPAKGGQILAVVLSEMGNTTDNILVAVCKALRCEDQQQKASEIHEFAILKELYLRTIDELGLDRSTVSGPLDTLEHHLQHVVITKELSPTTRDYLVAFGNRTSTEMFYGYLNKLGKAPSQEWELRDVTTYGRDNSDLTTTTISRALGAREIQVWKDVDGMFTCDPKVCANAKPLPYLTFDEAAELDYFDEQVLYPHLIEQAMECDMSIMVKNSYNPQAPGTVITKTRDVNKCTLTNIVLKSNITMLDIKSKRMLGQSDFASSIVQCFGYLGISVDCVASSKGKMSFTLVPSKLLSRELIQLEVDNVVEELQKIAVVHQLHDRSVISLIGNTQMSTFILERALNVLSNINVAIEKISQESSMVKVSLVVHDSVAEHCVQVLHAAFFEFENGVMSPVAAEAPPGPGQERMNPSVLGENGIGGNRGQLHTQSEFSDSFNQMPHATRRSRQLREGFVQLVGLEL